MENFLLLILGILLSVLGAVNLKGNIRTIHFYNRRNVKAEDIPKYGRAVGTGTLIIGLSLAAAFLSLCATRPSYHLSFFRRLLSGWRSFSMDRSNTITAFFDPSRWKRKRTVIPSSERVKKVLLTRSQTRPTALGSRLKGLRLAAAHSLHSHVCEPKSIFSDAHVAGENDQDSICACGRKLCEAFSTA